MIANAELFIARLKSPQHIFTHKVVWPVSVSACSFGLSQFAIAEPCARGYKTIELHSQDTGATVYGPGLRERSLQRPSVQCLPRLSDYGNERGFILGGCCSGAEGGPSPDDPPNVFLSKMPAWIKSTKDDLERKTKTDDDAITKVNNAVADITTLVSISDAVYQQPHGDVALANRLKDNNFMQVLTDAGSADYRTLDKFVTLLTAMQDQLQQIQIQIQRFKIRKRRSSRLL